ncbi:MAG: efflux RND transporter permease subunit [Gammaproteobacteria bacterium]|nr:efflux RND transporter permease subunit [Gammaproteobacteria bacterium]
MNLTAAALKRPITTIMAFVAMAIIGLVSRPLIPLESWPEVDAPFLGIQIPYPNATAKEVETEIVRPLEESIATMTDVQRMFSTSNRNGGFVGIFFGWGADMEGKRIELRAKIDAISDQFPIDLERLPIFSFNTGDAPILTIRISTERDLSNAYQMLDRNVIKRLSRLEGVANVRLDGVFPKQISIKLNADRVAAHNINLFSLRQQLQKTNFTVSAGEITTSNQKWLVRPQGEFNSLDDIRNVLIQPQGIKLSDIAEVVLEEPEREHGRHLNGTYAVGIDIQKASGSNLVNVADSVLKEISVIGGLPEMQGIELYVMNNMGEDVKRSLTELVKAGMIGAILAFIVLFLFLREPMSTLIVAMSVPFCLLITIGAIYFSGYSFNILTLMGMMLAIGMLVDNSVVVTENIFRKRLENSDPYAATIEATKEVNLAITAGTLTSVIVFAPIVFSEANPLFLFLKHTAFTIIVALLASLLIAQTLIPMLASRIKSVKVKGEGRIMRWLSGKYAKILAIALNKARYSVLGLVAIFVLTGVAMNGFKVDMNDEESSDRLFLRYNVIGIHPLSKTEEAVNIIEEYLFANKEKYTIDSVYSFFNTDRAESTIILKQDSHLNPKQVQKDIEEGLPQLVIGTPSFERQRIGGDEGFKVQLYGDSTERLREISREVMATLRGVEGLTNVLPDIFRSGREVQIKIKKDRAAQLGISPLLVANSVATALRGDRLRSMRTENGETEIRVEFADKDAQSISNIKLIPVYTTSGDRVNLEQVADVITEYGTSIIRREDRRTTLGISADFEEDADIAQIREATNQLLASYNFPPGYGWGLGRSFQQQDEDQKAMIFNVLLAIPLIFIVMAALFESLLYPLSIITSIGFSFIGIVLFFAATGTTFTLMSAIGALILIGIVVNNGIVLVEHINFLRKTGLERISAIIQAGRDRLRPILMTVITTVLGMVPLAVSSSTLAGADASYAPMAKAIIGGLLFSTVVSLIIVPVIYLWLDNMSRWGRAVRQRAA